MAATRTFQTMLSILLSMAPACHALQSTQNWNPLNVFHSSEEHAPEEKRSLHEVKSNAKGGKNNEAEGTCDDVCTNEKYSNGKTWEDKCVWKSCEGCDACKDFEKPVWHSDEVDTTSKTEVQDDCADVCTNEKYDNGKTWEEKCVWKTCQGCDACEEFKKPEAPEAAEIPEPMGDPVPPRMLVVQGCDASAAILKHAHFILERHGILTPVQSTSQVFKDGEVDQAMFEMHKELKLKHKTLVFKGTIGRDQEAILSKRLVKLGTLAAQSSRRNLLDQAVCMVKDCFSKNIGYPVMKGAESDMCMKRRQENPKEYKAFLNVTTLIKNMEKMVENVGEATADLQKLGYKFEAVNTEDLLDFEWNDDAIWTAMPAWKQVLKSWGISVADNTIAAYLKENAGTREAPPSHKDTIFNVDAVQEEMQSHPKYSWMFRE